MSQLYASAAHVENYSRFRPGPPAALVEDLITQLKTSTAAIETTDPNVSKPISTAVDVGCGSGQSTRLLAAQSCFRSVIGMDSSEAQIELARKQSEGMTNVTYRTGQAEDLHFLNESTVSLITACHCLHFLDAEKFFNSAARALCRGGLVAIIEYLRPTIVNQSNQQVIKISAENFRLHGQISDQAVKCPAFLRKSAETRFAELMAIQSFADHFQPVIQSGSTKTYLGEVHLKRFEELVTYYKSFSGYQKTAREAPHLIPGWDAILNEDLRRILGLGPEEQDVRVTLKYDYYVMIGIRK